MTKSSDQIREWLTIQMAEVLEVDPEKIDNHTPFAEYGLSSRDAIMVVGDMEEWLDKELSPTLIWEYPTIAALAEHLSPATFDVSELANSFAATTAVSPNEPIAIIGMGCRFPQASTLQAFWELLSNGMDGITEVPADRWDIETVYDQRVGTQGKMNTKWGGFVERVDLFDAPFFGISPREALRMDPQQRFVLEVAWEALEQAGIIPATLANSLTGVFIGISNNDYSRQQFAQLESIDGYAGTGNAFSISANRVSYLLDLRGPSIAVDTACSSSLTAVHLACCSLQSGESNLAIAGGVNLILSPEVTVSFSAAGMMAPNGRCRTFDNGAEGYVRGEGCGIVILKRLQDALRDGDQVMAVIRGSAVNQDGRSNGLTAPNRSAQESVIRQALENASVHAAQISYVEAHGTGTALGDPIEINALKNVLGNGRSPEQKCIISSVKANIGHLESAAGIAGLIKTALILYHGEIPPHLHFESLNENITLDNTPFIIPTQTQPWFREMSERFASISSFGFGGTNVHVVLQNHPQTSVASDNHQPPSMLVPLSAKTPNALQKLAQEYHVWLSQTADSLQDISYTTARHRTHFEHRLAVIATDKQSAHDQLQRYLQGENVPGIFTTKADLVKKDHKIAFVFPGQGSQWIGMGKQLLGTEPAFRRMIIACDASMKSYANWSLLDMLQEESDENDLLNTIDVIQPALFAIQIALATLWRSWGIEPNAIVGHSMGEVAGAYIAGALSLDDACRVICLRSQLLKKVSGKGGMVATELSYEEAAELISDCTDQVSVAVNNSAKSTVLAGDQAVLTQLITQLEENDVFCRWVKVDVASHSPQVDELLAELSVILADIRPQTPLIPIFSTVTRQWQTEAVTDCHYWVHNLRQPVHFATAIQALLAEDFDVFIEISPHPILLPSIKTGFKQADKASCLALPSLKRESVWEPLYESLGQLYIHHLPINWATINRVGNLASCPTYAWDHQRLWITDELGSPSRTNHLSKSKTSALLGHKHHTPAPENDFFWENELDLTKYPYLQDHQVKRQIVLPAAAFVEIALAGAIEQRPLFPTTLSDITFEQLLFIDDETTPTIQLVIRSTADGKATFQIVSRKEDDENWQINSRGRIQFDSNLVPERIQRIKLCTQPVDIDNFYEQLAQNSLYYGKAFQNIETMLQGNQQALAKINHPPEEEQYQLHPAFLDACFQVMGAAIADIVAAKNKTYVPVAIESITLYAKPSTTSDLWAYAICTSPSTDDRLTGDIVVLSSEGTIYVTIKGLTIQPLSIAKTDQAKWDKWLYQLDWLLEPLPATPVPASTEETWLLFADSEDCVGSYLTSLWAAQGTKPIVVKHGPRFQKIDAYNYVIDPNSSQDFEALLGQAFTNQHPCTQIVYLWGLDARDLNNIENQVAPYVNNAPLYLVQALIRKGGRQEPRLWLVTRGTQSITQSHNDGNIASAPLWGFGRVVAHEHPGLQCTCVDLSLINREQEAQVLFSELHANDKETQISLREDGRYVARLLEYRERSVPTFVKANSRPYRLYSRQVGLLSHLHWVASIHHRPKAHEVEIEVHAVGLNFLDVLSALGIRPDSVAGESVIFGGECAGIVTSVGAGITQFSVGDAVMGVAPGSFSKYVNVCANYLSHKPDNLSMEEAATIPITFMTAYYALIHLGRLQKGERVLIHSASGGTGLAAIQIAQWAGAEILATAGTEEKRAFLRETIGIPHVMDSRSLEFADTVMDITNGYGVDVILNSLTGDAIVRGLEILAPYGRFLEIGKRDIYQDHRIGLAPFQKNLSYFAIDLARMSKDRPELFSQILHQVITHIECQTFRPLPMEQYSAKQVVDAFHQMAHARHIGKIVVSFAQEAEEVELTSSLTPETLFRENGIYLITGGLGGLGLAFSQWMITHGARHLVLVTRRHTLPDDLKAKVAELAAGGAHIDVMTGDIGEADDVARIINTIAQEQRPLRGIIHAAAVLDDGILVRQTAAQFTTVRKPKMDGAWYLHEYTKHLPLDFFMLFSSVASLIGSPGQGNYAAANAFLDTLAQYRRSQGLVALSINWGPWAEIGLAVDKMRGTGEQANIGGIQAIPPEVGLDITYHLLQLNARQLSVMSLNLRQWQQFFPLASQWPVFSSIMTQEAAATITKHGDRRFLAQLEKVPITERAGILADYLSQQVAQVLRLSPEQINAQTQLSALGFDSLMALELRNRLEDVLNINLSVTVLWNYKTIGNLVPHIAAKMGVDLPASEPEKPDDLSNDLVSLSDEEGEALAALLDAIDHLSADELAQRLLDE